MDSLPSPSGKVLRKMEAKVFQSHRAAILKDLKDKKWVGSKIQQQYADEKISCAIKKVLHFE